MRRGEGGPALVPIGEIASWRLANPPAVINRRDLARQVVLMANLDGVLVMQQAQWYADNPDYVARMVERSRRVLFHVVEEVERRGWMDCLYPDPEELAVTRRNIDVLATGLPRRHSRTVARGEGTIPWRVAFATVGVLALLGGVAAALSGPYHLLGTDLTGNDVLYQSLKSVRTAVVIGTRATVATLPLAVVWVTASAARSAWATRIWARCSWSRAYLTTAPKAGRSARR